jgi:hypothetical protein
MLDEFLDTISLTQGVGVAFNQSGKENHPIRIDGSCLLTLRKIGRRTDISNEPILNPNGLVFDKLSGQGVKEGRLGENSIRRNGARKDFVKIHPLVHLFHMERVCISGFVKIRFYQPPVEPGLL